LKRHRLDSGGAEEESGIGCAAIGADGIVEPFPGGNLERIDSFTFPDVNFFILLGSL
jgi:hypothetical protein